jgi:hypothetical protein
MKIASSTKPTEGVQGEERREQWAAVEGGKSLQEKSPMYVCGWDRIVLNSSLLA